jgi:hypothetical protein
MRICIYMNTIRRERHSSLIFIFRIKTVKHNKCILDFNVLLKPLFCYMFRSHKTIIILPCSTVKFMSQHFLETIMPKNESLLVRAHIVLLVGYFHNQLRGHCRVDGTLFLQLSLNTSYCGHVVMIFSAIDTGTSEVRRFIP